MKFQTAQDMLAYIQAGKDLWSPTLNKYVFLYNGFGSICYYDDIDPEEASELQALSERSAAQDDWCAFLGVGGHICDTPEWHRYQREIHDELNIAEERNDAMDFCRSCFRDEWIGCGRLSRTMG